MGEINHMSELTLHHFFREEYSEKKSGGGQIRTHNLHSLRSVNCVLI